MNSEKNDSVYIVMPAYNEERNIQSVVDAWYPILEGKSQDSRLIVADSGSSDSTHAILQDLKKKYAQLYILSNTDKQHGPKLIALYNYAITGGRIIFFRQIRMGKPTLLNSRISGN